MARKINHAAVFLGLGVILLLLLRNPPPPRQAIHTPNLVETDKLRSEESEEDDTKSTIDRLQDQLVSANKRANDLKETIKTLQAKLQESDSRLHSADAQLQDATKDEPGRGQSCDHRHIAELMCGTVENTIEARNAERMKKEYNCGYGPKPRITAYLLVGQMNETMDAEYEAASLDAEEWWLPSDNQFEASVRTWIDESKLQKSLTIGYLDEYKIAPWVRSHHGAYTKALFSLVFPEYHIRAIKVTKEGFPIGYNANAKLLPLGYPHIILGTGFFVNRTWKEASKRTKEGVVREGERHNWTDLTYYDSDSIQLVNNRPLIVAYDHEPWIGVCEHEDIVINCKMDPDQGCINILEPHATQWWHQRERRFPLVQTEKIDSVQILADKTKFLAFMVKHCDTDEYPITAALRTALYDRISAKYKQADAIGNCRKPDDKVEWRYLEGNNADILRPYKFTIAFESSYIPGYHTEKLLNAIIGRTVPIYFGHETVSKLFNSKRFIHCRFDVKKLKANEEGIKAGKERIAYVKRTVSDDLDKCIELIKKVDQNDALWREMVQQPMLPGNKIEGTAFDLRPISNALRKAIEVLKPSWLGYKYDSLGPLAEAEARGESGRSSRKGN